MDRNELREIGQMLVDFLGEVENDIGELRKNLQESIEGSVENEAKSEELDEDMNMSEPPEEEIVK